jgi:hypothetical protein
VIADFWLAGMSVIAVYLLFSGVAEILHRRRMRRVWWTDDLDDWK